MRSRPNSWTKLLAKLGVKRKRNHSISTGRKLRFENCEDRRMLAVFTVMNANDAIVNTPESVGTLRQALFDANEFAGLDSIDFDPSLDGKTITLGIDSNGDPIDEYSEFDSELGQLLITESVTIDATDLPHGVIIDATGNDPTPNVSDGEGTRVFFVNMPQFGFFDVEFAGLTITGGDSKIGGGIFISAVNQHQHLLHYSITVRDSIITENHAGGYGNEVGNGFPVGSGGGLQANLATGIGGSFSGDKQINIFRTQITNNTADFSGGGLHFDSLDTDISLIDSTISNNSVLFSGPTGPDPEDEFGSGGGAFILLGVGAQDPQLAISGTTIFGNTATSDGGGLFIRSKSHTASDDGTGEKGLANITNSTISGNEAAGKGGGIYLGQDTSFDFDLDTTLNHVTISDNRALEGGGLYSLDDSSDVPPDFIPNSIDTILNHTIVSGNERLNSPGTPDNIAGAINLIDSVFNLLGSGGGATLTTAGGNILDDDPDLGPLQHNGGLTKTHAPNLNSLAVDNGDPAYTPTNLPVINGVTLTNDQRGASFLRVYDAIAGGTQIDIGAYEINTVNSDTSLPPQVINVVISGSNSDHEAYDFAAEMLASNWIAGDQLKTVPVGGADTVAIQFSESVTVNESFLVLAGMNFGALPELAENGFSYDPASQTATWRYDDLVPNDMYVLALSEEVADVEGNLLDGEWTNPASVSTTNGSVSEFPSGDINNTAGGDFKFVFTLLAGDASLDNTVNEDDIWIYINSEWFPNPDLVIAFNTADFDGDGDVDQDDGTWISENYGMNLQNLVLTADLSGDGIVDADDLWYLSLLYSYAIGENAADFNDLYNALDDDAFIDLETLDIFSIHLHAQFGLMFVS